MLPHELTLHGTYLMSVDGPTLFQEQIAWWISCHTKHVHNDLERSLMQEVGSRLTLADLKSIDSHFLTNLSNLAGVNKPWKTLQILSPSAEKFNVSVSVVSLKYPQENGRQLLELTLNISLDSVITDGMAS